MGVTLETLTSTTRESSPAVKQASILDMLKGYIPVWSDYRARYSRSIGSNPDLSSFGKPLDAKTESQWQAVATQMDNLLQDYFRAMTATDFEATTAGVAIEPSQPETVAEPLLGHEYDGA